GPEPWVLPLDDLPAEATPESSRPPAGFQRGRVLDSVMLLVLAALAAASSPVPPASRQIVLSVSASWDATNARVRRYERSSVEAPWTAAGEAVGGSLGRSGLAWGKGMHRAGL